MPTLTKYQQSGFVLEGKAGHYAFDIGLLTPLETVATIAHIDASFISHIHRDHYDAERLALLKAQVYGPIEVYTASIDANLPANLIHAGDTVALDGITVTAITADHGPIVSSNPIENLGYVIEIDDKRIWFLGDMAVPSLVPDGFFDLILVPMGGGGYVFSPEQAVQYMRTISHEGNTLPIHYDSSVVDANALEHFEELAEGHFEVTVLAPGESFTV